MQQQKAKICRTDSRKNTAKENEWQNFSFEFSIFCFQFSVFFCCFLLCAVFFWERKIVKNCENIFCLFCFINKLNIHIEDKQIIPYIFVQININTLQKTRCFHSGLDVVVSVACAGEKVYNAN